MTTPDAPVEAQEPEPGSPFVPAPRLGIIHLLVWTACTAVYLSGWRMLRDLSSPGTGPQATFYTVQSMLMVLPGGAALAALPLTLARRRRGWPFAVHPGETLWLVEGILLAVNMAMAMFMFAAVVPFAESDFAAHRWTFMVYSIARGCLSAGILLWAAKRTPIRWWRVFFVATALGSLLPFCTPCLSMWSYRAYYSADVGELVVLLTVLWLDRRAGDRRPWTHWVGVAVALWQSAVSVLALVWYCLVPLGA